MAKRREDFPLEKVTLNLYAGEFQKLGHLFPRIGSGKVIRTLVHNLIRQVEERVSQETNLPNLPIPEDILE